MGGARRLPDLRSPLQRLSGHLVAGEKLIDLGYRFVETVIAERVALTHARSTGVEHLILMMTRGELGADQVPCEPVQLDVLFWVEAAGADVALDVRCRFR